MSRPPCPRGLPGCFRGSDRHYDPAQNLVAQGVKQDGFLEISTSPAAGSGRNNGNLTRKGDLHIVPVRPWGMGDQDRELRRRVLLTFQVALLGMVTPALRGVTVRWDDRRILAHCLFDGPTSEEQREVCSDIEAEVMASFPDHEVDVLARRIDAPDDLTPELLDAWVYSRKE